MSNIEWCDITANPIHLIREDSSNGGHFCQKVSPGCLKCYAEEINQSNYFAFASHLPYSGKPPENLIFDDEVMRKLVNTRSPKTIFLCSMTDLFGNWIPDEWIYKAFSYMAIASQHKFLILTKRPERMKNLLRSGGKQIIRRGAVDVGRSMNLKPERYEAFETCEWDWPLPNVGLGTSIENQQVAGDRIPLLLNCPAVLYFLSAEPLLENIDLSEFLNHAIRQTPRRSNLSGDFKQGNRDRFRGQYLEDSQEGMGQVESMHSVEQVQAGTSGNQNFGLSERQSDVQQSEVLHGCSPPSVPTLLRQDSRRDDHQSHRWQQEKQPSVELGIGNVFSTDATRIVCPQEGQSIESVGRKEFDVETDISSSTGNQAEESIRGISQLDSTRLRYPLFNSVQNIPRSAMEGQFWVIVGGESGPGARPCHIDWIRSLVRQCQQTKTAVFVKQWGSNAINSTPYIDGVVQDQFREKLKNRKGGDITELPLDIQIREFPHFLGK